MQRLPGRDRAAQVSNPPTHPTLLFITCLSVALPRSSLRGIQLMLRRFECAPADQFVHERQLADHGWRDVERVERILAHGGVYSIEERRQPLPVIQQLLDRSVLIGR